jgi:predicted MPP superfamily phosphohydrolase
MIILPDVHGRDFWKDAVKTKDETIIFLGDYVDPYDYEGITKDKALENFKELLEYKKSNPSAILLLGNHDFMYMDPEHKRWSCRHDFGNDSEITRLFLDNKDLFQIGYSQVINGTNYTFSHSGILKNWLEEHKDLFGENPKISETTKKANKYYQEWNKDFILSLRDISWYRGGWAEYGSMIWADIREHEGNYEEGVYQIFGHSQLKDQPIITEHFADLDCRRAFRFNGKIEEL